MRLGLMGSTAPRCLAVWVALGAPVAVLSLVLLPALEGSWTALADGGWSRWGLEELVVRLMAAVALCAAGWLWLVAGVVALAAARGCRTERVRGCPDAWRRVVLVACGAALVTGALAAPSAAQGPPLPMPADPPPASVTGPGAPDLRGLPLPDRRPEQVPRARDGARAADVVVRAGDCLWDLAAAELDRRGGRPADAAEIDARWRDWHHANVRVVGADPDLLVPGQRLSPPTSPPTTPPDHP